MRTFLTLAFGEGKLPVFIVLRSLGATDESLATVDFEGVFGH